MLLTSRFLVRVEVGELEKARSILVSILGVRLYSVNKRAASSYSSAVAASALHAECRRFESVWEHLQSNPVATLSRSHLQGKTKMDIQHLPSGRIQVDYGKPVEYQSPILIDENYPSVVTYKCALTGHYIGKVYKTADGKWWLASCFYNHWTPIEVFSKIEGFLLLNNLYKQNNVR